MTFAGADDRQSGPSRLPVDRVGQVKKLATVVLTEPFQVRTWSELAFFILSGAIGVVGAFFLAATFFVGLVLAVVFVGVLVIAGGLRAARGIGGWQRGLARHFLGERIDDPEPFHPRPGFLGWLGGAFRDGVSWRALGYIVAKVPLIIFGIYFALRIWLEALLALINALAGTGGAVNLGGFPGHRVVFLGYGPGPTRTIGDRIPLLIAGTALLFLAPWLMRLVIYIDRMLIRVLLGPDPATARLRRLEQSRAQAVDTSAATLRRIERDLHDGTQAQLVALAMRLGQVKDKLSHSDQPDLEGIRRLVDEAHRGAKDAIVELRDLARGIHPPVLDTGLESALATLTARSSVPTTLQVSMDYRPTPAIEAIAYFCVAELLANVAQHAQASRAWVTCTELGPWLRIVVRDDGRGGADLTRVGSSSSGLAGLTDRVASVDGHLSIASPAGGPSVITVDLPLQV